MCVCVAGAPWYIVGIGDDCWVLWGSAKKIISIVGAVVYYKGINARKIIKRVCICQQGLSFGAVLK